ncbi:cytochrome b5-like heme/steroid binding domain-containing protein [Aspergillus floccosus]
MSTATPEKSLAVYSREQVAEHNKTGDFWMIINQEVYDVTEFESEHPGGGKVLLRVAGKDATKEFQKYHRDAILRRYKERLQIGVVNSAPPAKKSFLKKLFR